MAPGWLVMALNLFRQRMRKTKHVISKGRVMSKKDILLPVIFLIAGLFVTCSNKQNASRAEALQKERQIIEKVVNDNIKWALNKDLDLLYSTIRQDSTFLIVNPDASLVEGFAQVEETAKSFWMDLRFKATYSAVKDLRVNFSESGTVAWYYCSLDDFGEWNGRPYKWENARWTGVLEKIHGKWVIQQMHISFPQ